MRIIAKVILHTGTNIVTILFTKERTGYLHLIFNDMEMDLKIEEKLNKKSPALNK
tara:strand:- start:163 stop:327 length:165 start_codon:yes stop_codon:yes gene_type:complete